MTDNAIMKQMVKWSKIQSTTIRTDTKIAQKCEPCLMIKKDKKYMQSQTWEK